MKDLVVTIALTLLVQTLVSIAVVAPAVLAPVAQADIGVAARSIGIFTALIYATAAISAPLGGAFIAHSGALRVSQYCLLTAGCGFMLCLLAHPAAWAAAALLIGCGYGPVTPASSEILVSRTPDRVRNLVMSIRQSGVPVGGAIAGVAVPLLLLVCSWQAVVALIALSCVAYAVALQAVRRRYDGSQRSARHATRPSFVSLIRMVFAHAELRRGALASFAYGGMQWCLASFLVVFLTERANLALVDAGFALSAAMVGGIVGRVLWGVVADALGSARPVLGALGIIMSLAAFTLSQTAPGWSLSVIVVVCTIYGASAIGWNGVYVAEIARMMPLDQVALATGASLSFTYFGVVIMPFAFWLIVTLSGSYAVGFIVAGMATLAAGLSYFRRVA